MASHWLRREAACPFRATDKPGQTRPKQQSNRPLPAGPTVREYSPESIASACGRVAQNGAKGYRRGVARPQHEFAGPNPRGALETPHGTSTTTTPDRFAGPRGIPRTVPSVARSSSAFRTQHPTATRHPSSRVIASSLYRISSHTSLSVSRPAGIRPGRCVTPAGSLFLKRRKQR